MLMCTVNNKPKKNFLYFKYITQALVFPLGFPASTSLQEVGLPCTSHSNQHYTNSLPQFPVQSKLALSGFSFNQQVNTQHSNGLPACQTGKGMKRHSKLILQHHVDQL